MGRIIVMAAMLAAAASPAGAQSFEQYENRQQLQQSNRAVTQTLPARDGTSATINNRIERQQFQREVTGQQQMLRAQPPALRVR